MTLSALEPSRLHLGGWAMLGLASLGVFGGLVSSAQAAVPSHPETVLEMPQQPAPPQRQGRSALTRPALGQGDYLKHGVNFSQLLTDREFADPDSTDAGEVTAYLKSVGSWLARTPVDGQKLAADVIMEAAHQHQVNPWVLLATLEKETSVVSRTAAPPKATLRKAMGFGYDDGGSRAGKHSNFTYQVNRGARLLRELYDEGQTHSFPTKVTVDYGKRRIVVRNAATWALLRYTPHTVDTHLTRVGGGNFLFRKHLERMVAASRRLPAPPVTILATGD